LGNVDDDDDDDDDDDGGNKNNNAMNRQNYARYLPVYLADMHNWN